MIRPTVGRVVLFHKKVSREVPGNYLAAIVTWVWSDSCVNLCVFPKDGLPVMETSVSLLDRDPTPDDLRFAVWMPYQKGQAQKTEDLEKKLSEKEKNEQ